MGRVIEVTEKMRNLVAGVAKFSQSKRLKVGAVIFKPSIDGWLTVCSGHNKHPKGLPMEYAEFGEYDPYDPKDPNVQLVTHPDVIHAELSAIRLLLAADYNLASRKDMLLVSTHSPCLECAKLIFASGIQTVRFGEYYRDKAGVEFLEMMGVDVEWWGKADVEYWQKFTEPIDPKYVLDVDPAKAEDKTVEPKYYYLRPNVDHFQSGDEYQNFLTKEWTLIADLMFGSLYEYSKYTVVRRKIDHSIKEVKENETE